MAKKVPRFVLNEAPGNGLSEYQFPAIGHVFPGGRSAITKWQKMLSYTRSEPPLSQKRPDSEKQSACGSNYPTKRCLRGCSGFMKLSIKTGKCGDATVTDSSRCLCTLKVNRSPSVDRMHDTPHEIFGDLILHINASNKDFVVDFAERGADGRRNNGVTRTVTFFTAKARLFECIISKVDEQYHFVKMLEQTATINRTNVVTPEPCNTGHVCCSLCSGTVTGCLFKICHAAGVSCEMGLCGGCLRKFYESRQFSPLFTNAHAVNTDVFTLLNTTQMKCSFCRTDVKEYVVQDLKDGSMSTPINLPVPYGWVGDRALMDRQSYNATIGIYTRVIKPYVEAYKLAVAKCRELYDLPRQDLMKKSARRVLHLFMDHCISKMYKEVRWLRIIDEEIPPVETSESVDPYDSFEQKGLLLEVLRRDF